MKSERTREVLALALLGAGVFMAGALASYREHLPPTPVSRTGNVCGAVGFHVAHWLLHSFGYASYLLVLVLFSEGIRSFRRRGGRPLLQRLPGLLLFALVLAATLSHLFRGATRGIPDAGGDVGAALHDLILLHSGLGGLGGRIALFFLLLTSFVLASGLLYSRSVEAASSWYRESGGVRVLLPGRGRQAEGRSATPRRSRRPKDRRAGADGGEERDDAGEDEVELETGEDAEDLEGEDRDDPDDEEYEDDADQLLEEALRERPRPWQVPRSVENPVGSGPPPAPAPRTEASQAYEFPPRALLEPPQRSEGGQLERATLDTARKLTQVLASFKVEARVVGVQRGPSISMLEVELAAGTKLGRLRSLEDDLAMNLAAQSVRIVAPIPGKSTAGIEIPNEQRDTVTMVELLEAPHFKDQKFAIPIFLGKDASGAPLITDLASMPHLLVAGSTGSGKSVCLNTIIMSTLFTRTPEQVKLILIDPKMVEFSPFQNVPHLMCPVVTDMKRAATILEWAVEKMEARYQLLHQVGVRNIYAYNKLGEEKVRRRLGEDHVGDMETALPFIVIMIDELADLMLVSAKDVEQSITRLAQKSRAVGIHVILATQRPSINVITGLIKANLPTRIAFRVASKIDSRVILDCNGAEKLLGAGDMLYLPPRSADLVRVQGTFLHDHEIQEVVEFVAARCQPSYSRELMQKRTQTDRDPSEVDELFDEATRFVVETQRGSASLLQRRFQIGYTRASRLIDLMGAEGYLGDYKGSQAREVLITLEELEQHRKQRLAGAAGTSTGDKEERQ